MNQIIVLSHLILTLSCPVLIIRTPWLSAVLPHAAPLPHFPIHYSSCASFVLDIQYVPGVVFPSMTFLALSATFWWLDFQWFRLRLRLRSSFGYKWSQQLVSRMWRVSCSEWYSFDFLKRVANVYSKTGCKKRWHKKDKILHNLMQTLKN